MSSRLLKVIIILALTVLLIAGFLFYFSKKPKKEPIELKLTKQGEMKLASPVFENNQIIPSKYTCDGEDINPSLEISDVPEGTQSLVLVVDDPDAPMGTWDHWIVWNIAPQTASITENSVPVGAVQGTNSFRKQSYGGPCPPSGTHHYRFKLYALDIKFDLDASSRKADIEKAMEGHILDWAELIGLYQR